jgi:hypothetical protein
MVNVKVKFALDEDPDGEVRYWLRPRPGRFTSGNNPVTIA